DQRERASILKQIAEQRRKRGQEGALTGSHVLLVGLPTGVPALKSDKDQVGSVSDSPSPTLETPVDQQRIFARTLFELLTNARLRLETATPENGKLPAKFAEKIGSYDCIWLAGDSPRLAL